MNKNTQARFQTGFALAATLLLATAASAQNFALDWFTLDSGGGTSTGGDFVVSGAITQSKADAMNGGTFSVTGEFVSLIAAVTPTVPPPDAVTTIFDNTSGVGAGFGGASTTTWLASKFCLGSQSYDLDSVSLLLSSGGGGFITSTVQLQIYSHDPVSGKPAASTKLIMNLSDLTNPITISAQSVKWTPATPFVLSANTCYWAVFSESGALAQIASVTLPTGAAGIFGQTRSQDAGATWEAPNNLINRKMLIQGTASGTPVPTPALAADGSTTIPGGTGPFITLPFAPSLSGNNLAFYGTGSGGQQGIYLTDRAVVGPPYKIADLKTPIPNGAGDFLSFGTEAGIIIVSGKVLFSGRGSGTQQGIYLADRTTPGQITRITDTATPIPAGQDNFTAFLHALAYINNRVAFVGSGSGGRQGIYAVVILASQPVGLQSVGLLAPPQVGSPLRLADTATAIPGGTGTFTEFPSGPALSESEAAFIGNGSGGQQGLYAVALLTPPQVGTPRRIADTATAIPSGTGNFTAFGSDLTHPVDPAMSGDRLAFVGSGSGGQQGIYGASVAAVSPPYKIADTATAIPGGAGNFTGFGAVSISESDVAFLGTGAGGQTGIYALTGGPLRKVISVGEGIQGKTITALSFSRDGLSEDGAVAFQATFNDGSQGVYTFDAPPTTTAEGLRLTVVSTSGNELRISFPASSGQSYVLESRADLAAGAWAEVPGTTSTGNGALLQVAIPNAFAQPQQFYRVKIVP